MRLVDTSAWIEWLTGSPVGKAVEAELPKAADWLVPTIVQYELAKWLAREAGEAKADRVIAFTGTCKVVALDSRLALLAAELGAAHRLAMADAMVYATARAHRAEILTCDRHFEGLAGVRYLPKRRA